MSKLWYIRGWLYESLFALKPHRELVKQAARLVHPDERVLDAGCGTGRLALGLRSRLFGADFSVPMLRKAKGRGMRLAQADVSQLPFCSHTFDRVISINVLYAVANPVRALDEMVRVLAPGGELVLATPVSRKLLPLVTEHFRTGGIADYLLFLFNLPRLAAWVVVLAVGGISGGNNFTFWSEDELVEQVEATGLKVWGIAPCYAGIDRMVLHEEQDLRTVKAVRADLLTRHRAFTFLHIGVADRVGHAHGFMSPAYLDAVRRVDGLVGRLLAAIDNHEELGDLIVVLTADHGGIGPSHYQVNQLGDMRVPFMVWGPGVEHGDLYAMNPSYVNPGRTRPDLAGPQPVRNGDVANLVTDLLGLSPVPGSRFDATQQLQVLTD